MQRRKKRIRGMRRKTGMKDAEDGRNDDNDDDDDDDDDEGRRKKDNEKVRNMRKLEE